jgi:hypothetical protein
MVSTLNVAAVALGALLFWTCLGSAITRRVCPPALALPFAPTVGWAVHSVLALPILRLTGFSQFSVIGLALLALVARFALAHVPAKWTPVRRQEHAPKKEAGAGSDSAGTEHAPARAQPRAAVAAPQLRVPAWAWAAAALLALAPAVALLPKSVADGVILAGPIYDHSKIAMVDEMARLGVPPGNPFFGEGGGASRLVYYYLWHFSAAELAAAFGVSGWAADIALTWVTAFASLALMMGLAVLFAGRRSAALWVIPLALAASLRPVLTMIWSADRLDAVLLPGTGFAGWLFQSAWVPQHLMSASCVVAAIILMSALIQRGILRVLVLALVAAAAFESSTWVGGVTFALAAPVVGAVLLWQAERNERWRLFARFAVAAALTIVLAAPFLHEQLAVASRDAISPVALDPFAVLGAGFPDHLRRVLDLPAYWLVLLPIEFPAIVLTGTLAAIALLRAPPDRPERRETLALALLAVVALAVSWLLASTLGENNDLAWRAALPAVAALSVLAAAGIARWTAAGTWTAVAAALVAIALGLPRSVEILRDNAAGHRQPAAAAFAQAPAMWAAVRRHSLPDERVGNNPLALRAATPWPVNIGWALLANRRSCYAGREFALVFTGLPAARRAEIDAQFVRVFAGEGSPDDLRDLAMRYGCRVIALTAADGAWTNDPFAASPFFRVVETAPGRWKVYRALAPGDGGYRS